MSTNPLRMENLPFLGTRPSPAAPATPKEAGRAFEELMASMLLKEMHGDDDGPMGTYQGLFDQEIAKRIADSGGLGIGKVIEEQLSRTAPGIASAASAAPSGARVTSSYGWRKDPLDASKTNFHGGLDLKGAEGSAIRAQRDGVVTFAGPRGGYGNLVVIDHGNGLETRYGHCSRIDVKAGERVAEGQTIAGVGHTGRATGPHLHLEARQDGKPFDPSLLVDR